MSNISDNKIILLIDKDDTLAEQLTANLDTHEIIHVKNEMEADLKYREVVSEDKQINLIVLYGITGNTSNWEAVLETLFDVSIQPNIIVLDANPDIQKAVSAYSNMAYHYHDKNITTHDDVNAWIQEIKANPVPQIKLDKSFYKDNVWSRHVKDQHELLVEVKLADQFNKRLDEICAHETGFLTEAIAAHRTNDLTLEQCRTLIEKELNCEIDALKQPNLLIIEDEELVRKAIITNLEDEFNLLVAEDGNSAIKLIKDHAEIDLALMDIYLPDIKGTELYPKIRELNDLIILTALTAYKDSELAEKLIRKGAFGFLNKPFKGNDVRVKLSQAWNRKVWPFFEGKMNLQSLSYIQRLYFLDHLIKERKSNKQTLIDGADTTKGFTRYQLNSMLSNIYNYDIYGLFPEFLE